jgi:hypothetical protein
MLFVIALQFISLLPPPQQVETFAAVASDITDYQRQVLELATHDYYSEKQILELRPQRNQYAELAALLPYSTATQAKLIAVLSSGCAADSSLSDALLQLALRSRDLDVRLACLLAPTSVSINYLPALACLSLSSDIDLSLRAVACGRLLEHHYYSAWPLAKAILLTGTASDATNGHDFPDWKRSGRYELPKRLLTMMLVAAVKTHHRRTLIFEPNAAWIVQEQQVATIDAIITQLRSSTNSKQLLPSSFEKLNDNKIKLATQAKQLLGY